jgi:hypothetical protein
MKSQRVRSFIASQRHPISLSPFLKRAVLLRMVVIACLFFFVTDVGAQQNTKPEQTDKTDSAPAEEKPKEQQKTETRSTTMAATGDSAAGSIGGIKSPESIKVSSGGAASQSIPIVVPPGTAACNRICPSTIVAWARTVS